MSSRDVLPLQRYSPIVIEFFGLPGSGKSTIARELHEVLTREHFDLIFAADVLRDGRSLPERVAAKAGLILTDLVAGRHLGVASVLTAFKTPQPSLRDKVRSASTLATVSSVYSYLRRLHLNAVLDQGLLQCLWTIQIRSSATTFVPLVEDLLRTAVSSGHVHISVETPPLMCAERLSSRSSKHSRLQASRLVSDEVVWDRAELLRRELLSRFQSEGWKRDMSPPIISVDGMEEPKIAATKIVAQLLPGRQEHAAPV